MNNNQRDPRWAETPLGDGSTTIGFSGCTVSAIGDVLGVTPDVINAKLKSVQGFFGALIIWAKIEEAFPGVKVNRVWSYNNDDVAAHVPNVIVEVPAAPIGGSGSHWVNYIGNQQLKDPWTGTIRPTSDFPDPTGYCVLDITNYQPQPTVNPLQTELDQARLDRDTNYNLASALFNALGVNLDPNNKESSKQEAVNAISALKQQHDKDAQTIIDLKAIEEKMAGEDKNYAQEALDAQHATSDVIADRKTIYDQLKVTTTPDALVAIVALQKPHEEVVKQVVPVMNQLAEAAIYKRVPKTQSFLDWIVSFLKKGGII